ncbi:MAG: aminomethyl-transferring glycine dehydrogenase subunit GcvPA [Thiotrichales bacterium]|nr:MAG: aminomethyl-transferring glycine dehydrogenase subunit GcvPA [Thiotrichales bacterium]
MPFIPHTEQEIDEMLETIGIKDTDELFEEIPSHLRVSGLDGIPPGMTEMEISQLMHKRAAQNNDAVCFIGAGAYEHHIPAAVWQLTTRGEYYTAYTPYQAEASQGTLQLTYEYQSMITALTGMDVSNASLYDGASALAEAILMAVRGNRKSKTRRILLPRTVHPAYRKTADTIVSGQNIELVEVDYDRATGTVQLDALKQAAGDDITAVVIQQPSFFGTLEDVDAITDWAHENNALLISITNPLSIAVLKPPGQWGSKGADIACGDGQPLGAPMSSGGPYYGFLCCSKALVRQMPGRIVGRTTDVDGKEGFVLTLQAREQHIRRSKATSNICTNQGLVVTASTIHMAILGPRGLENTAAACHANTRKLVDQLTSIDGVRQAFSSPVFHESALLLDKPVDQVLAALAEQNIHGGYNLAADYPELGDALLVCATELRTDDEIMAYRTALQAILGVKTPQKEIA